MVKELTQKEATKIYAGKRVWIVISQNEGYWEYVPDTLT